MSAIPPGTGGDAQHPVTGGAGIFDKWEGVGSSATDETSFAGCYVAIAAVVGIFFGGFVGFGVAFGAFYAPGLLGAALRLAMIALTIAVVVGLRHLHAKGPTHMSSPERHARLMRQHQAMQNIASIMPATGISIDHLMFFFRVKSLTGPNISIRYYLLLWWGILFVASIIPGALTGAIVQADNPPPTPAKVHARLVEETAASDYRAARIYWISVQPDLTTQALAADKAFGDPPPTAERAWVAKHATEIVCGTVYILRHANHISFDSAWELQQFAHPAAVKRWLARQGKVKC
ncbi:MAG: hypothetical protein ACYDDQ_01765 [Vulcanimicrobiaceae bacterium]